MKKADRKLAYSVFVVLVVLAAELAWFLFVGPANRNPYYATQCQSNCEVPFWASPEFWTALFTAVLTGSTILLWRETKRLAEGADAQATDIKAQIKATEDLAKAAKKTADIAESSYSASERPYIFIRATDFGMAVTSESELKPIFTNYGKTPGVITSIFMRTRSSQGLSPAAL